MTANRYYGINNSSLGKSLEKLASGYAINRAGDNAAGLAVSEKMRAQIGGLTQASKNAEDGISLVQTFEGALQETDSILQRMRTLAVQSANGSYQDDVDRDAIQLEFDQLNDELNQIADTDFNGTVMLNGGVMADGVHAVGGKIDYANKKAQVTEATDKSLSANLDKARVSYNEAKKAYSDGVYDLSASGDAPEWNTVDNSSYNKNNADALWVAAGLTKTGVKADGTTATTYANTDKADTIAVTYKYDGAKWVVDNAEAFKNGEKVDDVTSKLKEGGTGELTITKADTNSNTGEGGFNVKIKTAPTGTQSTDKDTDLDGTSDNSLGNAIFDATNVTKGSTVTLVYKNGDTTKYAPNNLGINESSIVNNVVAKNDTKTEITPTITPNATNLKDAEMTEEIANALKAVEDAKIEWTYDDKANFADGDVNVNGNALTTGGFTKISDRDGNSVYAKIKTAAGGEVAFYSDEAGTKELFTVKVTNDDAEASSKDKNVGTYSLKISTSTSAYSDSDGASLTVGSNSKLSSSNVQYDKYQSAKTAMADAQKKLSDFRALDSSNSQDWEKIKTMYAESQSSSGSAVSISDSLDNSRAKLTYTDTMSLQVGARTKDLVNFTFQYASDDLGGLEKNLNCSAREGGLNTANLSLRTQSDANDAIDQIDKALNKVNMVRATFGSVQNRLEHKINNLDTNNENLTAAESRIRDTQMDKEMMKFTSSQILSQASQSMLAQANQLPQGVLQLLG